MWLYIRRPSKRVEAKIYSETIMCTEPVKSERVTGKAGSGWMKEGGSDPFTPCPYMIKYGSCDRNIFTCILGRVTWLSLPTYAVHIVRMITFRTVLHPLDGWTTVGRMIERSDGKKDCQ